MPSENVQSSGTTDASVRSAVPSPDRRTRKRAARRDHLLDLADDLVERHGVDGLTMAALAEASDYAPASLYTYFPSRSALLAALQQRALRNLARVGQVALAGWEADGEAADVVALARLWAFSDLFLAAPRDHARDFRLQQQLLLAPAAEDTADAAAVVPDALAVLELPRRLLADAAAARALEPPAATVDPVGDPLDGHLLRTVLWALALNGTLMADRLVTGLPTTGELLGGRLTATLLAGWGADPTACERARTIADGWRSPAGPTTTGRSQ